MAIKEKESIPFIALTLTTAICIIITLYSLSIGWFIIHQNLFYIPIIIACVYYYKRGLLFSILLAGLYFILFATTTADPALLQGAAIRVLLFILIAGVITWLSMQRAELATRLSLSNDELTATNEELLASEEEIRSHVDELYSAQQIITDTKDRYLALFEAAGDAIFLHEIDADGMPGKFNEVNGRACESLGYTREELLGLTVIDIAGEKAIREAPDRMQELLEWGHSIFESDHKRKDGSTFPVEVSSRVIRHPDETLILSVVRDISERKAAEEALRQMEEEKSTVLNSMPVMLAYLNPDLTIRYANRASAASVGMSQQDLIGRHCFEIWHGRTESCDKCPVLSSLASNRIEEGEVQIPDGRIFHLKGCPVYDDDGNFEGIIEFGMDITRQREAEDALRLTSEKLQILSSITRHDILNHITTVLGFLDFAEGMSVDETQAHYLDRIKTASKNIQRAIEFTREYENLGIEEPRWLQLTSLINKVSQGELPIENDCQEVRVFADPMIEKVFYNLYDNTLRHAEGATGILIHCETDDGDLLIIWEDDGTGVPEEMKERIFSRGFGKNTGFGLFLSREILGITGTTITENGIPGKGARFEIRVRKGHFEKTA
ncbi:PAS domain S-box protein [Methanocalculus sp.]|uniref:PAS domain S-box protein n=1 Tax=Methanocalculus sp. TaxID=2004547 RepID=UPI00262D387C|nr:PAS domain S-box protein [Methanocalculus sp.]MDG6249712.1 PAS domain S-box protein [Methanocalculus sp.]